MNRNQELEQLKQMLHNLNSNNSPSPMSSDPPLEVEYSATQTVDFSLPPYGRYVVGFCASGVSFFGIRFALYIVLGSIGGPSTILSLAAAVFCMVSLRQAVTNQDTNLSYWLAAIASGFIMSQVFSGVIIFSNPELRQLFIDRQVEASKIEKFEGVSENGPRTD